MKYIYIYCFRDKYSVQEIKDGDRMYNVTMFLTIHDLDTDDFDNSNYTCLASNSIGNAIGLLRLHGK